MSSTIIQPNLSYFYCPLSKELYNEPVIASDGFTYEKTIIVEWLQKNKTSPLTRENITKELITNMIIKQQIAELLSTNPELKLEQFKLLPDYKKITNPLYYSLIFDHTHFDIEPLLIEGFIKPENEKYITHIINHAVDLNVNNSKGTTLLIQALIHKLSLDIIKLLVSKHVNLDLCDNITGIYPIHYAIQNSSQEIVKYLIDLPVNLEVTDNNGKRPIHYMLVYEKNKMIKYILNKGVSTDIVDNSGRSLLYYATYIPPSSTEPASRKLMMYHMFEKTYDYYELCLNNI